MTPRARSAAVRSDIRYVAPRILNEPVGIRFSALTKSRPARACPSSTGRQGDGVKRSASTARAYRMRDKPRGDAASDMAARGSASGEGVIAPYVTRRNLGIESIGGYRRRREGQSAPLIGRL